MSDLIRREDAINAMAELQGIAQSKAELTGISKAWKRIKALPAASPWHMVEEPPKEEHRTYLVYTDTGYMCSCRWTNNMYGLGESDRWGWSIADVPQFQKVTHWMPIEPPKEEEHGN